MSDSVFSSGAGKVVIYYAAAGGSCQRVKRHAAAPRSCGSLFSARATNTTQDSTAGGIRAGTEELMKRAILIASVAAAALALAALAHGAASPQTKTHQFRCTDKNTSLYFLVYERN